MKAKLKVIEGHLMTGISYILPVIIGASLIVGLAKLVGLGFGVSDLNPYKDAGGILRRLFNGAGRLDRYWLNERPACWIYRLFHSG